MHPPHDPNVTADNPSSPATDPASGQTVARQVPADPLATTAGGSASAGSSRPGADTPASDFPAIPGYRVLREIARGGMGKVLAAVDLDLDRDVALKILLPGANADRFVRESKITARLPHPGIPPVYAMGALADGSPFLAMKLIAGQTLTDEMKSADRPRLLQAFTQICQAVGFAHSRNVIHRDLKPANIMVGAFGEVQVMDWGLAKDLTERAVSDELPIACGVSSADSPDEPTADADRTRTTERREPGESTDDRTQAGQVMGTPAYMAPEQARGETTDPRADVFALGGILCAILTGHPPFRGKSSLEVIRRAAGADLTETHARLDGCAADGELIAVCRRCLNSDPEDRPANGQAVADDLAAYLNGVQERLQASEREQAVTAAREGEQRKRRRAQSALTAVVLLVLVAGAAVSGYFAVEANSRATEATAEAKRANDNEVEAKRKTEDERKAKVATAEALVLVETQKKALETERDKARFEQRKAEFVAYSFRLEAARRAIDVGEREKALTQLNAMYDPNLCGWEHDFLIRQCVGTAPKMGRESLALQGRADGLEGVAFTADGKWIYSQFDRDRPAKIWNAATGQETLTLKNRTEPSFEELKVSPDGKWVVSWGFPIGTLTVWDATTGEKRLTLKGHAAAISCAAFSPDGKRIVSGCADQTVKVWDALTGAEEFTLKGHARSVLGVAFSPDGKRIVSACQDGTIKIWDAGTGQEVRTLKDHTSLVCCVAFSPDGKRVVSGSADKTLKIWDAGTGEVKLTLLGHTAAIWRLALSPDGTRIVSASLDKTVKVWDAVTGQECLTLVGHKGPVFNVAFRPDGKQIFSWSSKEPMKVWDATIAGSDSLTLKGHTDFVTCVAYSSEGKWIVSGSQDKTVRVWDAATGRERLTLKGHAGVSCLAISPDGSRIVSAGIWDNPLKVWDVVTGQELFTLTGHDHPTRCVAFSPSGKRIVSASLGGRALKVWDATTGQQCLTLHAENGTTYWSVSYSPDGKRIVSGSSGRMTVWNAETGDWFFTGDHLGDVRSVAYSPDGKWITSASGNSIVLWDAGTGRSTRTLNGHSGAVNSVSFSPDGKWIVSGSQDKTVRVWDAATGDEIVTLQGHSDAVTSVAFSPDGKRIVSASNDKKMRVWDAERAVVDLAKEKTK